jgi:hypothetical protein
MYCHGYSFTFLLFSTVASKCERIAELELLLREAQQTHSSETAALTDRLDTAAALADRLETAAALADRLGAVNRQHEETLAAKQNELDSMKVLTD